MKNTYINILFISLLLSACGNQSESQQESGEGHHQHAEAKKEGDKKPLSPRTASMAMVGSNHVHIDYGSPSKRGRMIFGGLVGFGNVWATGAHKATTISFDKDVIIEDTPIAAGKYGLFTIPGENEWVIIINKDWDMHLADDYDEANDVVRITSAVEPLDSVVESLTFEVKELEENSGTITIKWDQTAVSFQLVNQ